MDRKNAALRALALLDLTLLDEDVSDQALQLLCEHAETPFGPVAAICIQPRFVAAARERLRESAVRIATVANFPSGNAQAEAVTAQIESCVAMGADEVDVVYPLSLHLQARYPQCESQLRQWREAAQNVTLKVILETGELGTPEHIKHACELSLAAGADFLKTSTGTTAISATPEAARIMLNQIRSSNCPAGLKVSGGIGSLADAAQYLDLADRIMGGAWATPQRFRFGASRLLDALTYELKQPPALH